MSEFNGSGPLLLEIRGLDAVEPSAAAPAEVDYRTADQGRGSHPRPRSHPQLERRILFASASSLLAFLARTAEYPSYDATHPP